MTAPVKMENWLPYRDTKAQGAADFYFAINGTFRFIRKRLGKAALIRYWTDLGTQYMQPVTERWKAGGLPAIAAYWNAFFHAEPGGDVRVDMEADAVRLTVNVCPLIHHLRANDRTIEPDICEHCYYVSEAAARPAGFTVRIEGGNGSCRQSFFPVVSAPPPQDLNHITRAS